ncbi:unnamed protein product [Cyclocybe aegerita]|uniref:Uncharacterized protein n=1 Tax=Cyclocybe aegerita TaxID=1973307 RepID=A0A8S0X915_CYCAE|nr:unnamed protein product [Cyclocybe aegerita]
MIFYEAINPAHALGRHMLELPTRILVYPYAEEPKKLVNNALNTPTGFFHWYTINMGSLNPFPETQDAFLQQFFTLFKSFMEKAAQLQPPTKSLTHSTLIPISTTSSLECIRELETTAITTAASAGNDRQVRPTSVFYAFLHCIYPIQHGNVQSRHQDSRLIKVPSRVVAQASHKDRQLAPIGFARCPARTQGALLDLQNINGGEELKKQRRIDRTTCMMKIEIEHIDGGVPSTKTPLPHPAAATMDKKLTTRANTRSIPEMLDIITPNPSCSIGHFDDSEASESIDGTGGRWTEIGVEDGGPTRRWAENVRIKDAYNVLDHESDGCLPPSHSPQTPNLESLRTRTLTVQPRHAQRDQNKTSPQGLLSISADNDVNVGQPSLYRNTLLYSRPYRNRPSELYNWTQVDLSAPHSDFLFCCATLFLNRLWQERPGQRRLRTQKDRELLEQLARHFDGLQKDVLGRYEQHHPQTFGWTYRQMLSTLQLPSDYFANGGRDFGRYGESFGSWPLEDPEGDGFIEDMVLWSTF